VFLFYVFSAGAFVFLNPPGNAPDEPAHVAYVRYWAKTGSPPVFEQSPYWPRYEAFQPPVYYGMLRGLYPWAAHRPIDAQFRFLRTVSIPLHGLALLAVFFVARRALGSAGPAAVGAAAATALVPMFCFVGASVTNDVLANAAVALTVWAAAREAQRPGSLVSAVLLGVTLGLAWASKSSAVAPAAAAFLWLVLRRRWPLPRAGLALATALLLSGPVFIRNVKLYGDPLAAAAVQATEPTAAGLGGILSWAVSSYESFWAVFGWMLLRLPRPIYWVLWALGAAAAWGVARARKERKIFDPVLFELLMVVAAVAFAQALLLGVTTLQAQGRHLFVGLAAIMPLFFGGMAYWLDRLPARGRAWAWTALAAFGIGLHWMSWDLVASNVFVIPGVYNAKGL